MSPQHAAAPAQSLPADVAQAAAEANLGRLRQVYTPKLMNWFLFAWALILCLVLCVVLVGFWALWQMFHTSPNLNRAAAARRLYLFELGFVLAGRPEDPQVYRWDGIDTVFQHIVRRSYSYGLYTQTMCSFTVTRWDGVSVKLGNFWNDALTLGTYVNQQVSDALLPAMLTSIQEGHKVQFGAMTLAREGITAKRGSATWAEVRKVNLGNGYVNVFVAGRKLSLAGAAASKVPNLPLFLTLVSQLRGSATTNPR